MKNYKLHVSDGFKDVYGDTIIVTKEVENIVLNTFTSFGYEMIKTPGLEYLDVYSLGGSQKPDLYNLINRQGEVLSLRNDMTSSVARFVSTNNSLKPGTLKYCYSQDTYRYPRLYQGKNHQFLQAGVELIGEDSMESDVSVIYLANKALLNCNCKKFTINIGSSLFLETLCEDFKINKEIQEDIYNSIQNKDYITLREILSNNLDSDKASFIIDLMMRGGKLSYIEKLMKRLEGTKSYKVLDYLKNIYLELEALDVKSIIFDFSIYSYAEYYTGIIFKIFVDNVTKEVVSGGRCNSLFKEYGRDLPNCGFGLDIDVLSSYVLSNNLIDIKKEKYLAYQGGKLFTRVIKGNEKLRSEGVIVSLVVLDDLDKAIEYAKNHGFTKVITYTENDYTLKEVA